MKYAHRRGVLVQAELGNILGKEGLIKLKRGLRPEDYMTDPEKVIEFVRKTGIDTLAISIGTMHGAFRGKEKIDFKRLAAIRDKTNLPLVLHGASGIRNNDLKKAIKFGIRIINFDTEMRLAFILTLKQTLKKKIELIDVREILKPSIEAVKKVVGEKIQIFGSAGKA